MKSQTGHAQGLHLVQPDLRLFLSLINSSKITHYQEERPYSGGESRLAMVLLAFSNHTEFYCLEPWNLYLTSIPTSPAHLLRLLLVWLSISGMASPADRAPWFLTTSLAVLLLYNQNTWARLNTYSPNWYACLSLGPYAACWVPTSTKQDPLPVHWFLPLHQCSLSIQWQVLLKAKIQHCGILLHLILAAHCQDKFPYSVKSIQHTLLNSFLQEVFTEHS